MLFTTMRRWYATQGCQSRVIFATMGRWHSTQGWQFPVLFATIGRWHAKQGCQFPVLFATMERWHAKQGCQFRVLFATMGRWHATQGCQFRVLFATMGRRNSRGLPVPRDFRHNGKLTMPHRVASSACFSPQWEDDKQICTVFHPELCLNLANFPSCFVQPYWVCLQSGFDLKTPSKSGFWWLHASSRGRV